jgi:phage terminase large subunit-like protein
VFPDPERQGLIIEALVEFEIEVERVRSEFKEKSASLVPTKRVEIKFEDDVIVVT